MKWTSALAIYSLFWCFSAFFVLPFHGRKEEQDAGTLIAGQDHGAPPYFRPKRILLQMTVASAAAFGFYYLGYTQGWFDPDILSGRA